jgi:hypothetical protein
MLFLLALLRGLARVVLGPLVWLMRLLAGVLFLGSGMMLVATLIFWYLPKDPTARNDNPLLYFCLSVGMLLLGCLTGTAANFATGFDSALGEWIYLRQLFFIARKATGKPVRGTLARFLSKQS